MKKIFSIGIVLLIILSGINFAFDVHYCNGRIAATKLSFNGEKASCGMETGKMNCPAEGDHFTSGCCHNEIFYHSVVNDYTAPTFQDNNASKPLFKNFFIPVASKSYDYHNSITTCPTISPPDLVFISAVSLPDLCIFRK